MCKPIPILYSIKCICRRVLSLNHYDTTRNNFKFFEIIMTFGTLLVEFLDFISNVKEVDKYPIKIQ